MKNLTLLVATFSLLPFVIACSGGGEFADGLDGAGPGVVEPTPCEVGDVRNCSITLEQKSGVLSCYHGKQECIEENVWSECTDGKVVEQIDPTYYRKDGARRPTDQLNVRGLRSVSAAPIDCVNNACDPECQYWVEDPPDESSDPGGALPPGPLPDWSTTVTTCAHQLCDVDTAALDRACHPCVQTICDSGVPGLSDCCDGAAADSWDDQCVEAVFTMCSPTPPAFIPDICDYSVLADQTAILENATGYPEGIGATQGATFNSDVYSDTLIVGTDVVLTNASNFGLVYSTGNVTTQSGMNVDNIIAQGNVVMGNSAVLTGDVYAGGNFFTGSSGFTVLGDVTALGTCNITNSSRVDGDMHCGGDVTINEDEPAGTIYTNGNLTIQNGQVTGGDVHVGGSLSFTGNGSRVGGNAYVGLNVTYNDQNQRPNGQLHAGGNVTCTGSSGQGAGAAAYIGGTLTGTCPGWAVAPVVGAASPPRIAPVPPTLPAFPQPPLNTPSVDDYRRDTTAVCAAAAAATDLTLSSRALLPGIYGDINIPNGSTMTLLAPGTYVFNSYDSGSGVPFYFGGGGPWDIIVCNKFTLRNAANMYVQSTTTRVPGEDVTIYSAMVNDNAVNPCNSSTPGNCCIQSESNTQLAGVLIAPDCDIFVGNGSSAQVVTWANNIATGSGVVFSPIDKEACSGAPIEDRVSCGAIALYNVNGAYALNDNVTINGKRYVCSDAALCNRATTGLSPTAYYSQYWPGVGSSWMSAWTEFDDCPDPAAGFPSGVDLTQMCPVTIEPVTTLQWDTANCVDASDCQVNQTCTEAVTPSPVCSHSKCTSGAALSAACEAADPCVEEICNVDPACCSSYWHQSTCADRVEEICGVACGATTPTVCPHDACTTGAALDLSCSAAVAEVCDPGNTGSPSGTYDYCCTTTWDAACVDEFTTVTTGSPVVPAPAANTTLCDYAAANGSGAVSLNSGQIIGDVYANGAINGNGPWTGDAFVRSPFTNNHTGQTGSTNLGLTAAPYTLPTWTDVANAATCAGTGTAAATWNLGNIPNPSPGTYGNVTATSFTFPSTGADQVYYVNSFDMTGYNTINLPADGSNVTIFVCGGQFIVREGSNINSPTNDPLQLNVWVNGSNIAFLATQWNGIDADGVFSIIGGSGTVNLQGDTDINGMVHNINGGFAMENWSTIDTGLVDRNACLARGVDPNAGPANSCPVGNTPAGVDSVTESGACQSNLTGALTVSQTSCAYPDLTLDAPCDDQMPVCNRGTTDYTANDAEIFFFAASTVQFATDGPDMYWADMATCEVDQDIPAGTCVNITCPSFTEDMTAFVQYKSPVPSNPLVSECNDDDNWTYYPWDRACGGVGGVPKIITHTYTAVCPNDSAPAWGFLSWQTALEGAATIEFEARTSYDGGTTWSSYTQLADISAANMNEDCSPLVYCANVGDTLFPVATTTHPDDLELRITLTSDGTDVATLEDWELSYSCLVDQ